VGPERLVVVSAVLGRDLLQGAARPGSAVEQEERCLVAADQAREITEQRQRQALGGQVAEVAGGDAQQPVQKGGERAD
jgi:hypothetical protein